MMSVMHVQYTREGLHKSLISCRSLHSASAGVLPPPSPDAIAVVFQMDPTVTGNYRNDYACNMEHLVRWTS